MAPRRRQRSEDEIARIDERLTSVLATIGFTDNCHERLHGYARLGIQDPTTLARMLSRPTPDVQLQGMTVLQFRADQDGLRRLLLAAALRLGQRRELSDAEWSKLADPSDRHRDWMARLGLETWSQHLLVPPNGAGSSLALYRRLLTRQESFERQGRREHARRGVSRRALQRENDPHSANLEHVAALPPGDSPNLREFMLELLQPLLFWHLGHPAPSKQEHTVWVDKLLQMAERETERRRQVAGLARQARVQGSDTAVPRIRRQRLGWRLVDHLRVAILAAIAERRVSPTCSAAELPELDRLEAELRAPTGPGQRNHHRAIQEVADSIDPRRAKSYDGGDYLTEEQ